MSPRRSYNDDGPFRELREPLVRDRPELESFLLEEDNDEELDSMITGRPQQGPLLHGLPRGISILLKVLYFSEALSSSTWGRFGALYYVEHGLNPKQIGLLEGCLTAVPTIGMPLWGILADRFRSRKGVYLGTKIVSTAFLLMLALPAVYKSIPLIFAVSIATKLFVSAGILDAFTLEALGKKHQNEYGKYRLWSSVSWGIGSMLMGLMIKHYHGFERNFLLYGILSIFCIVVVAWKIPDTGGVNQDSDDTIDEDENHGDIVPPMQPDPTLDIIVEAEQSVDHTDLERPLLSNDAIERENANGDDERPSICDLIRIFLRPRAAIFCAEVIVMGAGMATVERLLFVYMTNELGSSPVLCGLCVLVNVIFELPIFWYAAAFKRFFGGPDGLMVVAMVGYITRVYGYTLVQPSTQWIMLPLETLHGVTFACFWTVLSDVTKALLLETADTNPRNSSESNGESGNRKPDEGSSYWSTTLPCIIQTLYSAVGVGLGSVFGGWAMHKFGSRPMYRFMSAMIAVLLVFHVAGCILVRLCRKRTDLETSEEGEAAQSAKISLLPDFDSHESEGDESDSLDDA